MSFKLELGAVSLSYSANLSSPIVLWSLTDAAPGPDLRLAHHDLDLQQLPPRTQYFGLQRTHFYLQQPSPVDLAHTLPPLSSFKGANELPTSRRLISTKRDYGLLVSFIGLNVLNWLNRLNWCKDVKWVKQIYRLKQFE
ncbi:hypothetical protein B0H13DRAFT_1867194 [Mycena leptocephala]|nr:hypothetical protein B0H13DRAFT_1867194 [Mycena leptocephala]